MEMTLFLKSELKMVAYNLRRLQTIYKIESALSRCRALIADNQDLEESVLAKKLEDITGSLIEYNDFVVEEAEFKSFPEKEVEYFQMKITGKTGRVTRTQEFKLYQ